jgi:putative transcriptional regulator
MTAPISPTWTAAILRTTFVLLVATAAPWFAADSSLRAASIPHPSVSKQLTKGKFLVASRDLLDPNFYETVVLLADYGPNGASGLVINRPSEVTLAELLPGEEWLRRRNDAIYLGGPVAQDRLILLIRSAKKPAESHPVFADVYISGSASTLHDLTGEDSVAPFRAYAGYAGWGPGQLESEVERGDWWVVPAEADAIFEYPSRSLWEKLIERSAGEWASADRQILAADRLGRVADPQLLAPGRAAVQRGAEEPAA